MYGLEAIRTDGNHIATFVYRCIHTRQKSLLSLHGTHNDTTNTKDWKRLYWDCTLVSLRSVQNIPTWLSSLLPLLPSSWCAPLVSTSISWSLFTLVSCWEVGTKGAWEGECVVIICCWERQLRSGGGGFVLAVWWVSAGVHTPTHTVKTRAHLPQLCSLCACVCVYVCVLAVDINLQYPYYLYKMPS